MGRKGLGPHSDSKVTRQQSVFGNGEYLSSCNAEKRELFFADSSRKLGRVKTGGLWSPGRKVVGDIEKR